MKFWLLAAAWFALLVAGFGVVLVLGAPVATSEEDLEAALNPPTPVTQEVAEASAATIIRMRYPSFREVVPTTELQSDFGKEHWVVEYTDTSGPTPRGVRVSIVVESGNVEVTSFP